MLVFQRVNFMYIRKLFLSLKRKFLLGCVEDNILNYEAVVLGEWRKFHSGEL
jgi:hypothetical protein